MFMHESMKQLALKIREPGVDHFTRTSQQLSAYASWPGVGPNAEEEVADADGDGEDESDDDGGSDSGSETPGDSILEASD